MVVVSSRLVIKMDLQNVDFKVFLQLSIRR